MRTIGPLLFKIALITLIGWFAVRPFIVKKIWPAFAKGESLSMTPTRPINRSGEDVENAERTPLPPLTISRLAGNGDPFTVLRTAAELAESGRPISIYEDDVHEAFKDARRLMAKQRHDFPLGLYRSEAEKLRRLGSPSANEFLADTSTDVRIRSEREQIILAQIENGKLVDAFGAIAETSKEVSVAVCEHLTKKAVEKTIALRQSGLLDTAAVEEIQRIAEFELAIDYLDRSKLASPSACEFLCFYYADIFEQSNRTNNEARALAIKYGEHASNSGHGAASFTVSMLYAEDASDNDNLAIAIGFMEHHLSFPMSDRKKARALYMLGREYLLLGSSKQGSSLRSTAGRLDALTRNKLRLSERLESVLEKARSLTPADCFSRARSHFVEAQRLGNPDAARRLAEMDSQRI